MRRQYIICMIVIAGMLLIAGIWTLTPFGRIQSKHEYLVTKYYRFEEVTEDGIEQCFTPEYNHIDSIGLFLANISPEMDGDIILLMENSEGKTVCKKRYEAASIPTGEFKEYKIGKILKPGEQYYLHISYDGRSADKPQVMVSERNKNLIETEEMTVDGSISDYNMAITYYYSWKRWFGANH